MGETFKPFLYRKLFSQIGHYYQIGWPCARHPPLFYTQTHARSFGWTSQEQEEDGRQETMCWFYFILFFQTCIHLSLADGCLPLSGNVITTLAHLIAAGKARLNVQRSPSHADRSGNPFSFFFSVSLFLFSCFSSRHTHKDVELGFKHTKNCIYIYIHCHIHVYRYIHRSSRNQ